MEAKSSAQMGLIRRFFDPVLANYVHATSAVCSFVHVSERENFFHQKVASLL